MSLFAQCGDKVAFGLFKMAKTLVEIDGDSQTPHQLVKAATGFSDADTTMFLMIFDIMLEKVPDEYVEDEVAATEFDAELSDDETTH